MAAQPLSEPLVITVSCPSRQAVPLDTSDVLKGTSVACLWFGGLETRCPRHNSLCGCEGIRAAQRDKYQVGD